MKTVNVTTKDILDELYSDSALTWEGLDVSSIGDAIDWIRNYAEFKEDPTVYITLGSVMNDVYYLTGSNAYPKDLTIVSFKLSDLINLNTKLFIDKFNVGARWFDDIVDNNLRREGR